MKKTKNAHLLWVAVATVAVVMPLRQAILADHGQAHATLACSAPANTRGMLKAACVLRPAKHRLDTVPRPSAVRGTLWV